MKLVNSTNNNPLIKSLEEIIRQSSLFNSLEHWKYKKQQNKIDFSMPIRKIQQTG